MGGAMRNGSIPCMSVLSDAYHIELGMLASQKWEEVVGVGGVGGGGIWSTGEVDAFVHEGTRGVCTEGNRSGSFRNVRRGFRFSVAWLGIRSYF